jgi:thiamine biosynthesis lipoprotein
VRPEAFRTALLPFFLPALAAFTRAGQAPEGVRVERRLAAMGTWLELCLSGVDRERALTASEAAVRAIEASERRLSTWREDSELACLNRAPVGTPVLLSPELAADLARAREQWLATGGAFDPGLGALVSAWGLRTGGRAPAADELAAARAAGGFAGFELDGRRAVRRHALAAVEEGGFGKGIGLAAALSALRELGVTEAVIDLGGQLAVLGSPFTTTLADPRDRARAVLELRLERGSLATTGNSERGILVDGLPRAHVLDPERGEPVEDFGSLSVWSPDPIAADCLSTGLYVMGPEHALAWCARERSSGRELELVVLRPEGGGLRALCSEGWRGRVHPLVPGVELVFVAAETPPAAVLPPPQLPR